MPIGVSLTALCSLGIWTMRAVLLIKSDVHCTWSDYLFQREIEQQIAVFCFASKWEELVPLTYTPLSSI